MSKKEKTLLKRVKIARERLCCCNEQARTYAREYAKYLEELPMNSLCMTFEEFLEN